MQIRNIESLDKACSQGERVIDYVGSDSQTISKTFNARKKLRKGKIAETGAHSAAAAGILFGPIGWGLSAAALGSSLLARHAYKTAEEEYFTLPHAHIIEDIEARYDIKYNDGKTLRIEKTVG